MKKTVLLLCILALLGLVFNGCLGDDSNSSSDGFNNTSSTDVNITNPTGLLHGEACTSDGECKFGTCLKSGGVASFGYCTKDCTANVNSACGNDDKTSTAYPTNTYACLRKKTSQSSVNPLQHCAVRCATDQECVALGYTKCLGLDSDALNLSSGGTKICQSI